MELVFDNNVLSFWEPVTRECISQEETMELIVPDSFPDVVRIVDSWARPVLRGKECRTGAFSVTGTLDAGLLFLAEGEDVPRCMQCAIPFTIKLDHTDLTGSSMAETRLWIKGVDARALNSRKVMIRAQLCCDVSAWEKTEQQIPVLKEESADLQLRKKTYPVLRCRDVAERSLAIQEEAELPRGLSPVEKVLDWTACVRLSETKTIGSRLAFRGELDTEILYQAADGSVSRCNLSLPLTQYVEMDRDVDGMMSAVSFCVTGRDLQVGEGGQRLYLNLNLLAQARASEYEDMELLEDLFSTKDLLTPTFQTVPVTAFLDTRQLQKQLRQTVNCQAERVERIQIHWEQPQKMKRGEEMAFTLPMRVQMLCRDESGALQQVNGQLSAELSLPAAENCTCYAAASLSGIYAAPTAGGVEVRCTVELTVDSLTKQQLSCVSGAERKDRTPQADRPALLVRRMEPGESLWDVAKACCASMQELKAVNHIAEEEASAGLLLMIPVQ